MSGARDMFNILNAWLDDQASLTTVLHHTGERPSRLTAQNTLRFRHIRNLALIDALHQSCNLADLPVTLIGAIACQ